MFLQKNLEFSKRSLNIDSEVTKYILSVLRILRVKLIEKNRKKPLEADKGE